MLGATGIESTPAFETAIAFERLLERGFPDDARKTKDRVKAAPGYDVSPKPDPYE